MVVAYIGQPASDSRADRKLEIMRSGMARNSDKVRTEGIRTVMTHATSDGRTMQVNWNQVSPMHAVVEIDVTGSAVEVVPRLK